jgi:hypothetical protein
MAGFMNEEMRWLREPRSRLESKHPGEWIAISGNRLVALGPDAITVLEAAKEKGIERPLVTALRSRQSQEALINRTARFWK